MIAEHIQQILLDSELSIPVVIGELPQSPKNVMCINEYEGADNDDFFDKRTLYQPIIKVVARTTSYPKGSEAIMQVLHKLQYLQDDLILSMLAVGSPIYVGQTETHHHLFQVTFNIRIKEGI